MQAATPALDANTRYYAVMGGLERFARAATRRTQDAPFASQLRLLWAPVALLGVGFALVGLGAYLPGTLTPLRPEFLAAALLVLAGSYGVVVAKTRPLGADLPRFSRIVARRAFYHASALPTWR